MTALVLRRSGMSLVVGFGGAALVAVMVLLVGTIANTMRNPKPVKASVPPVSAVVWGDYVFSSPPAMARWLRVHGVAYSVWADRHPPANHLLKKHQKHAAKRR
jgi:hypothetical protein